MPARHAATLPDGGAEDYDRLAPAVWNPVGNAVVAAADILVGERVLDLFAGTGAATVPAAQLVGPDGRVDAVDRSAAMLELAAEKVEALKLSSVSFHCTEPGGGTPDAAYDAIISSYGVVLLDDMDRSADRLIGRLRPGGRIALSVWDGGSLEPFGDVLRTILGDLGQGRDVQDLPVFAENAMRLASADRLHAWLLDRGLTEVSVERLELTVPLEPDHAWSLALASGYRGLLPDDAEALGRIRSAFLERVDHEIVLDAGSLIAVGTWAGTDRG